MGAHGRPPDGDTPIILRAMPGVKWPIPAATNCNGASLNKYVLD